MSNRSDSLIAFLLGAAIGAAAGVLMAPDSGTNTRKKLKKSVTQMKEKGSEKLGEMEAKVRAKTQNLVGETEHRVGAIKAAVNEGKAAYMRELNKS